MIESSKIERHAVVVVAIAGVLIAIWMWMHRNVQAAQAQQAATANGLNSATPAVPGGVSFGGWPVNSQFYPQITTVYENVSSPNVNITPNTVLANFLSEKYMPLFGFVGVAG